MENKKVSTSFAFAVIILLSSIFGFLFWSGQKNISTDVEVETGSVDIKKDVENETVDWQVYRNENHGFQIEYPKNMFLQEEGDSGIYFKQTNTGDFMETSNAFKITVWLSGKGETSIEKAKSLDEIAEMLYDNGKVEKINISGEQAIKFISVCEDAGCGTWEWYLVRNGKTYHFDSMLAYDSLELYEEIFSTLKFIK